MKKANSHTVNYSYPVKQPFSNKKDAANTECCRCGQGARKMRPALFPVITSKNESSVFKVSKAAVTAVNVQGVKTHVDEVHSKVQPANCEVCSIEQLRSKPGVWCQ